MRRIAGFLVLVILLICIVPARADWHTESDLWYVLELSGQQAGWMQVIREVDDSRIRTRSRSRMSIGRGPAATTVETKSAFVETIDGVPIEVIYEQTFAEQPVLTRWIFKNEQVELRTTQGERELVKTMPAPEGIWLTPAAADRFAEERRRSGADEIIFRTLDPEYGMDPVRVTSIRAGATVVEFDGREIPVTIWRTTTDQLPIESIEHYSEDGHVVHSEMDVGLGKMVMRLATREEAMRDVGDGPDVMFETFVRPDRPMPDPYRSTTARMRLRVQDGRMPELPTAGAQRVTAGEDGKTAVLDVNCDVAASVPATMGEMNDPTFLETSSMIDADDPLVRALAKSATRGVSEDLVARAEAMRAKVHRYITRKGLQTAFGSASETARTRSGDCSEHGVLLCAMLRADGIPARLATGLVYADGFLGERDIFGWHMWTQALIDGRWVDFDATLPTRYHAGHILTATSALSDGESERDLASIMLLMGNLDVEILEVGHE